MALESGLGEYCLEVSTLGRGFRCDDVGCLVEMDVELEETKNPREGWLKRDHFARGKAQHDAKTAQLWSV